MAKTKNNKLNIIDSAIVNADIPFELPNNWCWIELSNIINLINGYAFKSTKYVDNGIRIIRITNVQDGFLQDEHPVFYQYTTISQIKKFLLKEDDILISLTGNVGRIAKVTKDFLPAALNQRVACLRPFSNTVIVNYLYYYLQQNSFKNNCINNSTGTAQLNMSTNWLLKQKIAIAPINEQKRIVEKLDSLFEKLDEAKDLIQQSLDMFDDRKNAILHKAFSGELTAEWRENKGVKLEDWEVKTIQDVCIKKITDGTHCTPIYCTENEGFPFLSSKDVTKEKISWEKIKYIIPELHEKLYKRLAPQVNDILLAKNGTTGVAAIVEENKIFDIYVTLALLRPNLNIVNPKFLLRLINSPICKSQFNKRLKGIGVPNLHLEEIKQVKIPICSLDEQEEIVRILDSFFEKEDKTKELLDMIDKIDEMKKAILEKAFRGELNTNNPEDEPTEELVKRILANK